MSLLDRIGKGLVSFGTGIPQIDLDTREAENRNLGAVGRINEVNAQLAEQSIDPATIAAQQAEQREMEILMQQAAQGNTDAAIKLIGRNPDVAKDIVETAGIVTERQATAFNNFANSFFAAGDDVALQDMAIRKRINDVTEAGGIPKESAELLSMSPEERPAAMRVMQAAVGAVQQESGAPSEVQTFEHLTAAAAEVDENGEPTERALAAKTQLGRIPRAGISAPERIALEDLTDLIADSQARIREATKFAEATGATRARMIDDGFTKIQKLDENIRNLDKVVAAIDKGATTGAIVSRFTPTVRAATVELEQLQAQLGLDVVGSVQFGALSEGELDLAMMTALPDHLKPADLRQWVLNRQVAQDKLRSYLQEQIDFLDQGGTPAGWMREMNRRKEAAPSGAGRFKVEVVE